MIVRFLVKRLPLALITLIVLSLIVFFGGQLLPGDVGRAVLGPLADARSVAAFNHQMGVDRPLAVQYWDWIGHFVVGDMGTSYVFRAPVAPFVANALINSLKLAGLAFVLVVPLGILGGVAAALRVGRWSDRTIIIVGQSLGVVPEFISSIVLILIFGVWLRWLPMSADWPDRAGPLTQLYYLILPSLPLVIIFFGYVARVARTGAVEALDADYTRTAVLKGLPWMTVLTRHVLRNALLPTITVSASLVGYLTGGLVVVETLFHYRGIGGLIYAAAKAKDFPMLEAAVLTIGLLYTVATLVADLLSAALNPPFALGPAGVTAAALPRPHSVTSRRLRAAFRSVTLLGGAVIVVFWIVCAVFGERLAPFDPYADDLLSILRPPSLVHWFGTDQLGRDVFSRVIIGSRDILTIAPLATLLGTILGTILGLYIGYFGGMVDSVVSRILEALQALPLVIVALMALAAVGTSNLTVILVIGFVFMPLIARTVRSQVLIESGLDYVAAAHLRGDNALTVMFVEILPNVLPLVLVEMTVRLGFAIFTVASLSFIGFGIQPPSADWGIAISENYSLIGSYGWTVLFDAGATASLIVGVNLAADGIQGLFEA